MGSEDEAGLSLIEASSASPEHTALLGIFFFVRLERGASLTDEELIFYKFQSLPEMI